MALIDLHYLGSFQRGTWLVSERPLEDIWSRLGLFGSEEYLRENLTVTKTSVSKDDLVNYIAVRMRQAVELRATTDQTTLLTAPLALYYSFLNLTRACLAIREEVRSTERHGLVFKEEPQILACRAKLTDGTFTDYLNAAGISWQSGLEVSLDDCLSRIIEMSEDYFTVARKSPRAGPVRVEAHHTGRMLLHLQQDWVGGEGHFRSHWENEFPSLVPFCELEPTGCVLKIKQDQEPNNLEEVADLCQKMLDVNLLPSQNPIWLIVRRTEPQIAWPRGAYYFGALFILSNIVRYEPELIYQLTSTNSKWSWFLQRFIERAERFYPHLMFNWIMDQTYFFE